MIKMSNAKTRQLKCLKDDNEKIWDNIVSYFHSLSQEKQDAIMLKIYKNLYYDKNKHYSLLISGNKQA